MADQFYIEEFLFRGRRDGDDRPSAWHLIIGVNGTDPVGRPFSALPIKASDQAISEGWDLPRVLKEINRDVLAELETERAAKTGLEQQLGEAVADRKSTEALLAAALQEIEELKATVSVASSSAA